MKTLCLFILTLLALYNPKVVANTGESDILEIESYGQLISNITIFKNDPIKNIDDNLVKFIELINLYKEFQNYDTELALKVLDKLQNKSTLSGNDLYIIKKTFQIYYKFNLKIMEFASLYQIKQTGLAKFLAPKIQKVANLKAQLIWLTSNIVIMEHTEAVHKTLYLSDGVFRRIFKATLSPPELSAEEKTTLKELTEKMNELVDNLESPRFAKQIILIREAALEIKKTLINDEISLELVEIIQTNKVATDIAQGKKKFKLKYFGFNDAAINLFNQFTNFLSATFGNIAGSIQWRKGYLFENSTAIEIAKNTLHPMDIILEKSPFVLTDKLIPGHYGHAAIYLGTKKQLEEIGMWEHPDIIPHQAEIENGKTILEAVRPGVRLNSIEGFMNIDEYSIIRKTNGLDSIFDVAEQISRGIDQLGKDYDFNFDISTLDKIVCSELIYIVFGNVNWHTKYRLGRPTITPDDVGEALFMKNTPFKMTDYVFSTKRHKIETANINKLAEIYEYELRTENGDPVKDPEDKSNSFWKKETKCYKVSLDNKTTSILSKIFSRVCKTTYKEFYYEEQPSL